jgi:phosphatidylglycerophosphatase A
MTISPMAEPDRLAPGRVDVRRVFTDPAFFVAWGAGSGLAPRAPGTFGTLAAFPLHLLLAALPVAVHAGAIALLLALGTWACAAVGRRLGVHDPGGVVIDEIVAFLVVLWAVPATWGAWLAAFVLFRVFDIVKPWPIGWLDRRVPGAAGVMLDDLAAAGATLLVMQVAVIVGASGA